MILAWLLLLTGLTISAVAIYYSVVGLAAIFSAAVIPIIVMGSALEVAKLVCASWLKANWNQAPRLMKIYMTTAVAVLMLITSMGIFGFLSKAHSDQSLVSGDVLAKISIYDEKIKTAKDNIDANRKALKQMDESVDQSMARSADEKGADKAVALRRSQAKERARLQSEIQAEQKTISTINDERAPIAAEVRKVEAEVGPLKYIAAFVYGATDDSVLERAVTWVIITIIVVFDPLAVIMLLAAQMTFGWKKDEEDVALIHDTVPVDITMPEPETDPKYEQDDGSLTDEQVEQIKEMAGEPEHVTTTTSTLFEEPKPEAPSETPLTALGGDITASESQQAESELDKWNKMIEEAEREAAKDRESTIEERLATGETYINEEGVETPLEESSFPEVDLPLADSLEESKKKTYMIKDETGTIQIKNRTE